MRIPNKVYFPIRGVNTGMVTDKQPPMTAPAMQNVRPFDTQDGRARGGQRPALRKWGAGVRIGAVEQPVVSICSVASVV